jgi:ribonuclease P protein component
MTDEALRVDQTHLSAEQARAEAPARLSHPYGDQERAEGSVSPPRPGPQASVGLTPAIVHLKKRAEFLAARKGARASRPLILIEAVRRGPPGDADSHIGVGFTATKKIGGAVVRNRAKRRLRAAASALARELTLPGCDYVFIARPATANAPWLRLLDDMRTALLRLRAALGDADFERIPHSAKAPDQNGSH